MPRLIFLGVVFGIAGLLFSTAMSGINSAIAAAIVNTEPIVLAILGYFFAKQKLNWLQIVALFVVIGGAVIASVG